MRIPFSQVVFAAILFAGIAVGRVASGETTTTATTATTTSTVPPPLDGLCEASAALRAGCTGTPATCILVADNEDKKSLFEYRIDGDGLLKKASTWVRAIGDTAVKDAEALAVSSGEIIVVGSHSRKKSCKRDDERLRIVGLARPPIGPHGAPPRTRIIETDAASWRDKLLQCDSRLIVLSGNDDTHDARALRDEACKAITETESAAGEDEQTSEEGMARCANTFNIEAAIAVPDDGPQRLWVGLRAPLSGGRAILLRVAPPTATGDLTFDGVATVDLGGRGLRELAASEHWLYAIGGPVQDGGESSLWRMPAAALRNGARITDADRVRDTLPGNAEALVLDLEHARTLFILDGTEKKGADVPTGQPKECSEPARQLLVDDRPKDIWATPVSAPGTIPPAASVTVSGGTLSLNLSDVFVSLDSGRPDLERTKFVHIRIPVRVRDDVYALGFSQTLRGHVMKSTQGSRVLVVADVGGVFQTFESPYGEGPDVPADKESERVDFEVPLYREAIAPLNRLRRDHAGPTFFEVPSYEIRLLLVAERRNPDDQVAASIDAIDSVLVTVPDAPLQP
jgi:uncharacterized protein DUF3616